MKDTKAMILDTVSDLVGRFVYYDRKEDENLSREALNQALRDGVVTVDEIVAVFRYDIEAWAAGLK